jgi:uncharacterized protein YndB with AHSA1/START domain
MDRIALGLKLLAIALLLLVPVWFLLRDRAPVAARADIVVHAPIEQVWRIQTDIAGWRRWNPDIQEMRVDGPVGVGTVFVWRAGGITIESTITEFTPPTQIVWTGKTFGVNARHVWRFTASAEGTAVETEEVFTGPLPWLLPGTLRAQLDKALRHGVDVLKREAERSRS